MQDRDGTATTLTMGCYGLGVTRFELLTLHSPFASDSPEETRRRILTGTRSKLRALNRRVSFEVDVVCSKAIAPERALRYETMEEFRSDLECLLQHRPISARRAGPALQLRRLAQRHPAASLAGV